MVSERSWVQIPQSALPFLMLTYECQTACTLLMLELHSKVILYCLCNMHTHV